MKSVIGFFSQMKRRLQFGNASAQKAVLSAFKDKLKKTSQPN
jgi:hypothetical protein